ncbi:hypothetical protein CYMTET_30759, partial [Cymbomonas tetramitiformis]
DQIVVVNLPAEFQEVPFATFYAPFQMPIFRLDSKGLSCFKRSVLVGYPQHSFGRQEVTPTLMASFRAFLYEGWGVPQAPRLGPFQRPRIAIISRAQRNSLHTTGAGGRTRKARRHLSNEQGIAEALQNALGWEVELVRLETMPLLKQVEYMQRVTVLISVHTAGLMHSFWLQPGCVVFQINVPGTHYGSYEFETRPAEMRWRGNAQVEVPMARLAHLGGVTLLQGWAEAPSAAVMQLWRGSSRAKARYAQLALTERGMGVGISRLSPHSPNLILNLLKSCLKMI